MHLLSRSTVGGAADEILLTWVDPLSMTIPSDRSVTLPAVVVKPRSSPTASPEVVSPIGDTTRFELDRED
jgi:hypothetical protein